MVLVLSMPSLSMPHAMGYPGLVHDLLMTGRYMGYSVPVLVGIIVGVVVRVGVHVASGGFVQVGRRVGVVRSGAVVKPDLADSGPRPHSFRAVTHHSYVLPASIPQKAEYSVSLIQLEQ
jgi:hypothetical protein